MTGNNGQGEALVAEVLRGTAGDRSAALCLLAIGHCADADGNAPFSDVVLAYRTDHIETLRAEGRDSQGEAERLSVDEVREHLERNVLPRLAANGAIAAFTPPLRPESPLRLSGAIREAQLADAEALRTALRATGEHQVTARRPSVGTAVAGRSVLGAEGLVKTYKKRDVVKDVQLELHQGEIVGLLGPNGAGKTTTFYMIAGLIPPAAGRITLDGDDITRTPMFQRARRGIGYLSQEPSIFRKLTVEENILAILETLPLSRAERSERLERLLDELSIKHLRANKAFSLSGGERRRLEITRALVTQPRFMMLDEPFAGVDPIAVHDIQQIVASLKDRNIGVLISDHNVEQTLDIVDRAYIMFEGQVKVSGPVRDLIFDDTVSTMYFGPTLTARLRARFASEHP
ncbi:MAG: LPS export ABC transporter ATP-binding protein [Gemmatimonadaceae bacterium]